MFDPSVFENLKVVVEGAFYDLDLEGELAIIDRHDYVDLAYMSRIFEISTRLDTSMEKAVECTLSLSAGLQAFSSEKLSSITKREPGCDLKIKFRYIDPEHPLRNIHILKQIWDKGYHYRVFKHTPIGFKHEDPFVTIEIKQDKPIYEDEIDQLHTYVSQIHHILKAEG
ncbi:hypothetical protein [Bacillus sp. D386]|uniref:hypothetical protein n=1 Tax=Bacillus sp. D386 TaxID=2587155 RepID=UPI0011222331|nr:hypothetical protein [Bacillus sp. D386]